MPNIRIVDLEVIYKNKKEEIKALSSFNATFLDNKFNIVMGASGSGKSTLLRAISGLVPYYGDIFVNEQEYSETPFKDRNLSFVEQTPFLFAKFTIYDQLAMALKLRKYNREEIDNKIKSLARLLGFYHCLSRKPKQLSKGQQQKISIAKALIKDPDICLLDEPFSSIDKESKNDIIRFFKEYKQEHNVTFIMVTHNLDDAVQLMDYVVVLFNGQSIFEGDKDAFLAKKVEIFGDENEIK